MIIDFGYMVTYYVVDIFFRFKGKYALLEGYQGVIYGSFHIQPLVTRFIEWISKPFQKAKRSYIINVFYYEIENLIV